MDSILNSTKKQLGPTAEYDYFDQEIIMHINTVFVILIQMGVGPSKGFAIEDDKAVWTDFLSDDHWFFPSLKTYMYAKVRLIFDPPTSGSLKDALQRIVDELEWRLNFAASTTVNEANDEVKGYVDNLFNTNITSVLRGDY